MMNAASRFVQVIALVMALVAVLARATPGFAAGAFSDWAAVVVAGDWHAHDGSPSEIFDNSRHDVSADLVSIGFSRDNIEQFSVRPDRYPADSPGSSDARIVANGLWDLSSRTTGGCFVYFSSHGSQEGVMLGDATLKPKALNAMLGNTCADRPTVVIISACFSGVFVKPLEAPNRMILTAARLDRTSFGCGATNRYPYFDNCVLSSWPGTHNFPDLAKAVRACVAAREKREQMSPPSEPQLWIGSAVAKSLPSWNAARSARRR